MNSIQDAHRLFFLGLFDENAGIPEVEQKNLLSLWEILTLRWVLTGGNAQIYENFAQSRARSLLVTTATVGTRIQEVRDEIIAQLPTDDLVRTRLLEPTYSRNLVRYLYYRINEQLTQKLFMLSTSHLKELLIIGTGLQEHHLWKSRKSQLDIWSMLI